MRVSAGDLDRRITIQIATESRDRANDVILDWADGFNLWASKKDRLGSQIVSAQELIRTADTVFEVRRTARALTITPEKHRIVFQEKLYQIVSIVDGKERDDTLQILASSRPDGQGARGRGNTSGE